MLTGMQHQAFFVISLQPPYVLGCVPFLARPCRRYSRPDRGRGRGRGRGRPRSRRAASLGAESEIAVDERELDHAGEVDGCLLESGHDSPRFNSAIR